MWIQFSRSLEDKLIRKCSKKEILKENSYFCNSLEDQMVKEREHKADNDKDDIKKNVVVEAWLEDFEAKNGIYSGNSVKMYG